MERWTMEYLEASTNKQLIDACIRERRSHCTNEYAPLYLRLSKLLQWVEDNVGIEKGG